MKEIDWEERHFQICLAILSCPECGSDGHPDAPFLENTIEKADQMVELLKHHKAKDDALTSEETTETASEVTLMPTENHLGKIGYKDAKGGWVIDPIFDEAYEFSDGLAVVGLDGEYGYINANGDFIIEPKFEWALSFKQSVAFVKDRCGMYGLIDKAGEWIHEPMFERVWPFKDHGYARVKVHPDRADFGGYELYCWIDKSGKLFDKLPE